MNRETRRLISNILLAAGLIVIVFPALTEAYGYFAQARLGKNWASELVRQERLAKAAEKKQIDRLGNEAVAAENAVLKDALEPVGADKAAAAEFPDTKIRIPKIGLDQVVMDNVGAEALKNGPGHYRGTANPGQSGTAGIAGHRVTYTRPFNRIDELAPGDTIILETLDFIYEYRVTRSDVLEPKDLSALTPKKDGRARLTLTTCTPKYSARYRLDVQASLVKAERRRPPTLLTRLTNNMKAPPADNAPRNFVDLILERDQKAVSLDPNNVTARINLGVAYKNLGRHGKAIKELRQAVALDPNNPTARFQLADVYIKNGETSAAISSLQRAIETAPDYEPAHYRLGRLYFETDQTGKAIDSFISALAHQPLAGDTHYYLGRAYEKQGDIKRAEAAYREALKYVPDLAKAQAALKRLIARED